MCATNENVLPAKFKLWVDDHCSGQTVELRWQCRRQVKCPEAWLAPFKSAFLIVTILLLLLAVQNRSSELVYEASASHGSGTEKPEDCDKDPRNICFKLQRAVSACRILPRKH